MKCPVDKDDLLVPATPMEELPAFSCSNCQGLWLRSNDYLGWLADAGARLAAANAGDTPIPTWDTTDVKLCPDCGRFLMRFRVLPGAGFYLDRCSHCNGVWFDRQEWDALVARGLQGQVNQFFTKPYQTRLKDEETRQAMDRLYAEKFGQDDYARVKDIQAWLAEHPRRAMLVAFLQADDPYRI